MPDLILLDIMMPEMDGYEVLRRLKDNPATAHIQVVMLTALIDRESKMKGLEAGALRLSGARGLRGHAPGV